ncbi:hypothetical protein [Streptomyces specialis]|uniref:hypothetical protein n=1 Tax=Streptomyces specialis TaxID=498367 RepID=UPI000A96C5C9|nr:hypothetical protein [Streptomyces specialis]
MTPPASAPLLVRWRRIPAATAAAACAGALALTLGACGGSADPDEGTNGIGDLPAAEIEERARQAAVDASAVRLSGTVTSEGRSYRLDVRLSEEGGVGEVSAEGMTFELLRVGDELFLKADEAFWESEGIPEELETDPAEKLDGKYVRVAPEDPAYAQLSGFTDKETLLEGLLTLEGERETGDRGEIQGVRTIRVEADGGVGGAMDVSLDGVPYPMRLERGGAAGELTMDDWGEEFELRAPGEDDIVDYGDDIITPQDETE